MLLPAYASRTEGRASLTWRNRGSRSLAIRSITRAEGADAADADDLDGDVLQVVTGRGARVGLPARSPDRRRRPPGRARADLLTLFPRVVDQRRVVLDGRRSTGHGRELGKIVFQHAASAGLGQLLLVQLAKFLVLERREHLLDVDARIPHVQRPASRCIPPCVRDTSAHTQARRRGRRPASKPLLRQARTKLAARRLTSHSQGAGRVSSRSLMSKTRRRSGVA